MEKTINSPEEDRRIEAQPDVPRASHAVDTVKGVVRHNLDTWQRTGRIIDAIRFTDPATGFSIQEVEQSDLEQEEVDDRNAFLHLDLESGRHLTLTVRDRNGNVVGTYTKNLFVSRDHQLFIEDDESIMQKEGTGFGTRFQQHLEKVYREVGVVAAFRGCGLSIGRYEGAKLGYDFFLPEQRKRFARGFAQFLREQGVHTATYYGRAVPIDSLEEVLSTPQNFLAVHADRTIVYTLDGRRQECPADQAGKAFFLDQESAAKKELDPDNAYRGKWMGIKYFYP